MGNAILFPVPTPTYTRFRESVKNNLVWIKEEPNSRDSYGHRRRFPALYYDFSSPHTLLYFHGNSTDLGEVSEEMEMMLEFCCCNVLAIEYPGYGICQQFGPSPALIDAWGRAAFQWLMKRGISPTSVIPFGRSIGTGPAAKLAASLIQQQIQIGGLILHTPYLSIHKIVAEYASLGTWFIADHWNIQQSLTAMGSSTPLLIIHGQNDEIIPFVHGKSLFESYNSNANMKEGFFPEDSPHNAYLILEHLAVPIKEFLDEKSFSRKLEPQNLRQVSKDRRTPYSFTIAPYATPQCCRPVIESDNKRTSFSSPYNELSEEAESSFEGLNNVGLNLNECVLEKSATAATAAPAAAALKKSDRLKSSLVCGTVML